MKPDFKKWNESRPEHARAWVNDRSTYRMVNRFAEEYAEEAAEKYAKFCVMCDRNKLPLIKFTDFIELYYEEKKADKKED